MLKTILKTLTLTLLLQLNIYATDKYEQPAYDARLNQVTNAKDWFYTADKLSDSAFNLGVTYHKTIKDYKLAEFWYKQAYRLNNKDSGATNNLGYLYQDLKQYDKAIKWYKKTYELNDADGAFSLALLYEEKLNKNKEAIKWYKIADQQGHKSAAYNLALLYEENLKNYKEAIKWYEIAVKKEHSGAINNIAILYYTILKDNIRATQYYLTYIDRYYSKQKVLNFLKNDWQISDKEIKKGYELQLNSKIIPEKLKYKGGI